MGRLEWDGNASFLLRDLAGPSMAMGTEGAGFVMWMMMGSPALGWQSKAGQKNVSLPLWGPQPCMVMALHEGPKTSPCPSQGAEAAVYA